MMQSSQPPAVNSEAKHAMPTVLANLNARPFADYHYQDIVNCFKEVLQACNNRQQAAFHLASALVAQGLAPDLQQRHLDTLFTVAAWHTSGMLFLNLAAICNQRSVFATLEAITDTTNKIINARFALFCTSDNCVMAIENQAEPFNSPLGLAWLLNHRELLKLMFTTIAPLKQPLSNQLLCMATLLGDVDMTQQLIAKGADEISSNQRQPIPIFRALDVVSLGQIASQEVAELRLNISHCAAAMHILSAALMDAIYLGQGDVVQRLLAAGTSVNPVRLDEELRECGTPLHLAALMGRADLVTLLLKAGAQVDRRSGPMGLTPLMLAALHGQREVAAQLLSAGASLLESSVAVTAVDSRTVLAWSLAREENLSTSLFLYQQHCLLQQDQHEINLTVLQWAARYGRLRFIQTIAANKFDIGLLKNASVIAQAAFGGHRHVITYLLAQGAPLTGSEQVRSALEGAVRGYVVQCLNTIACKEYIMWGQALAEQDRFTSEKEGIACLALINMLVLAQAECVRNNQSQRAKEINQALRQWRNAEEVIKAQQVRWRAALATDFTANQSVNRMINYLRACQWLLEDLNQYLQYRENQLTQDEKNLSVAFTECVVAVQIEKLRNIAIADYTRAQLRPSWLTANRMKNYVEENEKSPGLPRLAVIDDDANQIEQATKKEPSSDSVPLDLIADDLIIPQLYKNDKKDWLRIKSRSRIELDFYTMKINLLAVCANQNLAHQYSYELIAAKMRGLMAFLQTLPRRGIFGPYSGANVSEKDLNTINEIWSNYERRARTTLSPTAQLIELVEILLKLAKKDISPLRYYLDTWFVGLESIESAPNGLQVLKKGYAMSVPQHDQPGRITKFNYLIILKIILFDRLTPTRSRSLIAALPLELLAHIFNIVANQGIKVIPFIDEQGVNNGLEKANLLKQDECWVFNGVMNVMIYVFQLFPMNARISNDIKASARWIRDNDTTILANTAPLIHWMVERVRPQHPYLLLQEAAQRNGNVQYERLVVMLMQGPLSEQHRLTRLLLRLIDDSLSTVDANKLDSDCQNMLVCQRTLIDTMMKIRPLPLFLEVAVLLKSMLDKDSSGGISNALSKPFKLLPYELSVFLDKLIDAIASECESMMLDAHVLNSHRQVSPQ
jgi:hypothetical protein